MHHMVRNDDSNLQQAQSAGHDSNCMQHQNAFCISLGPASEAELQVHQNTMVNASSQFESSFIVQLLTGLSLHDSNTQYAFFASSVFGPYETSKCKCSISKDLPSG